MLRLSSNFLLNEMSCRKERIVCKDMLEKRCAVVKRSWWRMEKIFIEKIILSYNAKYYAKSLKVKLYDSLGREWRKNIQKKI